MFDSPQTNHIVDAASFGTIIAAAVGWLPATAAIVGILWYIIQIYESQTFQAARTKVARWVRKQRERVEPPDHDDFGDFCA